MERRRLRVYKADRKNYLERVKGALGKYIPKPGLAGGVGAVVGAGVGSTVGFVGNAAYYLATHAGYLTTQGTDVLMKTYQQAITASGEWGLVGALGGLILFAKLRDYVLSFFDLKE